MGAKASGSPRVVVVGGGMGGLAAAARLAAAGARVTLFERAGHLGGKRSSDDRTGKRGKSEISSFHGTWSSVAQSPLPSIMPVERGWVNEAAVARGSDCQRKATR